MRVGQSQTSRGDTRLSQLKAEHFDRPVNGYIYNLVNAGPDITNKCSVYNRSALRALSPLSLIVIIWKPPLSDDVICERPGP